MYIPLLTPKEMGEWDRITIEEFGIMGEILMENASWQCVYVLIHKFGSLKGKKIAILAGPGNNGGDGFAVARHLKDMGAEVIIFYKKGLESYKKDAAYHVSLTLKAGIDTQKISDKGLSSIDEYNKQYPSQRLPYKLLIIDEVQDMFSGDFRQKEEFSNLLLKIAKKGRKFGLHFILTTQELGSIEMNKAVVKQIGTKISFRLHSELDAMKIFDNNKEAYSKATKLKPYHFVYSDIKQTFVAKADYLDSKSIQKEIEHIREQKDPSDMVTPIVIDGSTAQPKETKTKASEPSKTTRSGYQPKYDTAREEELLKKLRENERGENG